MKGVATSGERVGRYRLIQTLGEGGMGVVHLAVDPDGAKVAIKVLRPQVAGDATARRRLAREVDSMRRVHSPHVAEILDADVTAEQPYIVTQYVPGRTLEEIVEDGDGPLHGQPLQRLAVGLAAALSAIHGAGIIHRDLKPGNVMLLDGEPIVIDFGIAQGADATRLTATGMVIGTPGYLAPEIIEGEDAGAPSDVHAWAATLAFAATGRPPFGTGSFESIFYKIMNGMPDLAGMPAALLPLIRAAMARHPAERPTAVKLVQLARRIHLDSTVTDQTRIDQPVRRPAGSESAQQSVQQFAMPSQEVRPTTPQPAVSPAPVPAQPKDFKGLLPPAAPPPAPSPYEQPQYQHYPPAARPARRRDRQPSPYDPYGRTPSRPQPRRTPPDPQRPKPYGWYRLLNLIALVTLLGFAFMVPVLALITAVGVVLLLRVGDRAARRLEDRRTVRGPRSSDVVGAVIKAPLGIPSALMVTALLTPIALGVGAVVLGVLMFAQPGLSASRGIAYAVMVMIVLLFVGPGGSAPRRQMSRLWGAALPRQEAAAPAALVLGLFAMVLVGLSSTGTPDTYPVNGMSQRLESLRQDVRDLLPL
jgi:serine/threonine protein kinase